MKKYVYHFTVLQITGLLLLLSHFSHVRLCATPQTAAHQASLSLRFSRQEHWSGLPFPSPMHESEVAQSYPTLSNPMDCSPPGPSIHGIPQARGLEWAATASSHPWSYYMLIPNFEDRGKEQERGNILIYKFCLKIHSGVMAKWRTYPGEGNGNPLQYLAWEIPWREEPGRLQSMGSQESVRHNLAIKPMPPPHMQNLKIFITSRTTHQELLNEVL